MWNKQRKHRTHTSSSWLSSWAPMIRFWRMPQCCLLNVFKMKLICSLFTQPRRNQDQILPMCFWQHRKSYSRKHSLWLWYPSTGATVVTVVLLYTSLTPDQPKPLLFQRGQNGKQGDIILTCFQTVLIKVQTAAVVGLTQIVTPASWRFGFFQLKAPSLAGAGWTDPLWDNWRDRWPQLDIDNKDILEYWNSMATLFT